MTDIRYIEIKNCFGCPYCKENPNPPRPFQIWMCSGYGKNSPSVPLEAPSMSIGKHCPLPKVVR